MDKKIIGIFICILLILISVFSVSGSVNISKNNIGNQTYASNDSPQIQWWYDLKAPSLGSAAVGDIDNDGNLEIVFGTYFNDENIYALNAENGTLLWKYNTGGCNDASPAIADVDLDGNLEVIIPASSQSTVYCFDGMNGNVKWSRFTGTANCIDSPPAIADVDNDNKPEVVFGTFHGYVFCLNGEDGSICWQINLGTNSYIQSCPNILDIDGDQKLDVVVAQWNGDHRIYALNGEDGSTKWYSNQPSDWMYHGGSFADIDQDGKAEIAIGCYDNYVYVVNSEDGSLVWKYLAPYYVGAPTSIADLNNDGHLEIVFISYNILGVLSYTGSLLWSYTVSGNIFRGAAIADINGDGILDVAFGADDGKLRVLSGETGQVIWTYDLQAHYGMVFNIDNAPVIADFNNDGKLDIFVVGGYASSSPPTNNYGRAYVLSAGVGTGDGWSMFRHDIYHSACFHFQQNQADLECEGSLSWIDVKQGTTVNGSFIVKNIGDAGSILNWNITGYPNWGTWYFTPSNGNNLKPEDGNVTVDVEVIAPDIQKMNFSGQIRIENKENISDYEIINVSLATYKDKEINILLSFIEKLIQRFPMFEKILNLYCN